MMVTAIIELLRWPLALVAASYLLAKAITTLAKSGIKVEITTQRPILISTGIKPLQAAVEKVRI
jgi:hypothetical protein